MSVVEQRPGAKRHSLPGELIYAGFHSHGSEVGSLPFSGREKLNQGRRERVDVVGQHLARLGARLERYFETTLKESDDDSLPPVRVVDLDPVFQTMPLDVLARYKGGKLLGVETVLMSPPYATRTIGGRERPVGIARFISPIGIQKHPKDPEQIDFTNKTPKVFLFTVYPKTLIESLEWDPNDVMVGLVLHESISPTVITVARNPHYVKDPYPIISPNRGIDRLVKPLPLDLDIRNRLRVREAPSLRFPVMTELMNALPRLRENSRYGDREVFGGRRRSSAVVHGPEESTATSATTVSSPTRLESGMLPADLSN